MAGTPYCQGPAEKFLRFLLHQPTVLALMTSGIGPYAHALELPGIPCTSPIGKESVRTFIDGRRDFASHFAGAGGAFKKRSENILSDFCNPCQCKTGSDNDLCLDCPDPQVLGRQRNGVKFICSGFAARLFVGLAPPEATLMTAAPGNAARNAAGSRTAPDAIQPRLGRFEPRQLGRPMHHICAQHVAVHPH